MEKICSVCRELKNIDEFLNDKRLKSGKSCICCKCYNIRQKSYRTPERIKKYSRTHYNKIRNNKKLWEKALQYSRERYAKFGRKKYPNNCIVCKKIFYSVRKDRKFCSKKCISMGKNNGRWKGGIQKTKNGYIKIYTPHHRFVINKNFVLEHRLIMEKHIGRFLDPKEVVHHINGIKYDNRIENLLLLKNTSKHTKLHVKKGIKGIVKNEIDD